MHTEITPTLPAAVAFGLSLFAVFPNADAQQTENFATYTVRLQGVTAPNQPLANIFPITTETIRNNSFTPLPSATATVSGSADLGTNANGLGFASGHGLASAEAGVLRAAALAEAQAVNSPTTNVGGGAVVSALAQFTDTLTFTWTGGPSFITVSGTLLLDGDMSRLGNSFGEIKVGGTGLNPQSAFAEWRGDSNGVTKDPFGVFSTWVPGSPVAIPFSIAVGKGQTQVTYWLSVSATAGASFEPCPAFGPLCAPGQSANSIMNTDYSHTLAWGGLNLTNAPAGFSLSSVSGFDYTSAHVSTAPVPIPASLWLLGSALSGFGFMRRRAA